MITHIIRYYSQFPVAIPYPKADSHVLLTRLPLDGRTHLVRLACLKHAASVHSEPGSNSHEKPKRKRLDT